MPARSLVFTDESGTHGSATICLVAGFRASPGQWKMARREWAAVLRKPEYRIDCFHAVEFFGRKGKPWKRRPNPYKKWSERKAQAFIGELVKVIRLRSLTPIGCGVVKDDFKALPYREQCGFAGYFPEPGSRDRPEPYHFVFHVMLEDSVLLPGVHPQAEFHFTLADHEQYKARALEVWDMTKLYAKRDVTSRLKSITFACPEDEPRLQMADLLVHCWYKELAKTRPLTAEYETAMTQLTYRRSQMLVADAEYFKAKLGEIDITDAQRAWLRDGGATP